MELQNVVIVDAIRTAFTRGGRGAFTATRLDEIGAQVVRTLMERNPRVDPHLVHDLGLGMVGDQPELFGIGADQVAKLAGLPAEVATFKTNRQCGSSMDTMQRIMGEIAMGVIDCGIAVGLERMGRPAAAQRAETPLTKFNERRMQISPIQRDLPPDFGEYFSRPIPDFVLDAPPVTTMPQTAQNVAEWYELTREEVDEFAVESHAKYGRAIEAGVYQDEIMPLEVNLPVFDDEGNVLWDEVGEQKVVEIDECYRAGTNFEALSQLKPLPGVKSYGDQDVLITAGNSCPTNDGASAAILMSESKALELGLEPLARIVGVGIAGVKPQVMGIGPVPSTIRALRYAGLEPGDIDRVEFNEAFAAQVIPSISELGIPMEKVNVNGGSLAIGHPMGATGVRMVGTVAREVRRSGGRYGLATQCIGAGMGISTIIEAL